MRFLLLYLVVVSPLSAASPTLTGLNPSGGQLGKSVDLTVGGTFDPWPIQAWASHKGIVLTPGKVKGKFVANIAADVPAGLHWLRLYNSDGASEQRPFFVGTLPEVAEVDPNDDPVKPQLLTGNCVVNGKLNPAGDVDHFAIELKKGQTFVASLEANAILRSPMDGQMQLLDAAGSVVAENNDAHGLDPQIAFVVPRDGRYVVRIFAFPSMPDSSIRFFGSELCVYRLTCTAGGFVDHAFPPAVSLKDPKPIELRGWNIPNAAKALALKSDRLLDRLSVSHPDIANAVSIRIEPHPCLVEVEPNDPSRPQELESPATIGGHIQIAGDVDVFQFSLKKGDKRAIRIEADAIDSLLDPVLRILDETGKVLNESRTPKGNSDPPEVAFTALADGKYRVEIRDLYKHGGDRYAYRLRIAKPEPDFSLGVAADQFTFNAGESLEIPVTVARIGGFTQPIEIRAVDLPEGVVFEPGKPDAAKSSKLKLTGKKAISGTIRIVGVAGFERTARATITTFATPTESIFLTVRPEKK